MRRSVEEAAHRSAFGPLDKREATGEDERHKVKIPTNWSTSARIVLGHRKRNVNRKSLATTMKEMSTSQNSSAPVSPRSMMRSTNSGFSTSTSMPSMGTAHWRLDQ